MATTAKQAKDRKMADAIARARASWRSASSSRAVNITIGVLRVSVRCLRRRHTSIPIAAGQNEGHRFRHRELIANHAVDIALEAEQILEFITQHLEPIQLRSLQRADS